MSDGRSEIYRGTFFADRSIIKKNKEMESKNPITDAQIEELKNERGYSISKWEEETDANIKAFDDGHSQNDWMSYLCQYATRSRGDQEAWRKDLIKVANIALAAASAYDRKGGVQTVL